MPTGSLVVVGTGIKFASHLTMEARGWIEQAEKVLYLVNEPAIAGWIHEANSTAESLGQFYAYDKPRLQTYREITERILEGVRSGLQLCAVFYGHPAIFVTPVHHAVHLARQEGYQAQILPGISAEDCLFADLAIDPAQHGCQSFDATDFLLARRVVDTRSHLILWQVGVVGITSTPRSNGSPPALPLLAEVLIELYGREHEVVLYEAAQFPTFDPRIAPLPLHALPSAAVTPISTLYVPPRAVARWDEEMVARLGIDPTSLIWPVP